MSRGALTDKDIRRITTDLGKAGWSVQSTGDRNFRCVPPKGGEGVVIARTTSRAHYIYRQLRDLGFEADPRRRNQARRVRTHRPANVNSAPVFNQFVAQVAPPGLFYEQKPLLDRDLSEVARHIDWTNHALDRCNERSIGVFEVVSAIVEPDHSTEVPGKPNVFQIVRGDVGVVFNKKLNSVITVIALNERTSSVGRKPLHPTVDGPEPSIQQENHMTPKLDALPVTGAEAVRALLGRFRNGDTFTVSYLCAELPDVQRHNVSYQLQFLRARGLIAPTGTRGEYRIVKSNGIRHAGTGVVKVQANLEALAKARQAQASGGPTARDRVDEFLATIGDGEEFLLKDAMDLLVGDNYARATISGIFRQYVQAGRLAERQDQSTRLKTLRKVEPGSVVSTVDEDLVPVSTGFEFTELPASEVVELAAIVRQRMVDLRANPHRWAQIALYEASSVRPIESRMRALEKLVDNPDLQFTVRLVLEGKVGLFVRSNVG